MKNQSDEELARQYQRRFANSEVYRNGVWRILCTRFFSRYINPDAKVLDVGCGWGEFINNIEATEKNAMDLNADGGHLVAQDVKFFHQDCSTMWPLSNGYLDVVFTSNFLEHLRDKESVQGTVREAHRCLKDGGRLICLGPNIKYVPGAYWDFWDHHIPLTERSCTELLQINGFEIMVCYPRFLPYSMSTGSQPPLPLLSLYLQLPMIWPLFGKQFLVIGQKASQGAGSEA